MDSATKTEMITWMEEEILIGKYLIGDVAECIIERNIMQCQEREGRKDELLCFSSSSYTD